MFEVDLNSNMALATIVAREYLVCSSICCLNPLSHRRVPVLTKKGRLPLPLVQYFVAVVFVSVKAYTETNTSLVYRASYVHLYLNRLYLFSFPFNLCMNRDLHTSLDVPGLNNESVSTLFTTLKQNYPRMPSSTCKTNALIILSDELFILNPS